MPPPDDLTPAALLGVALDLLELAERRPDGAHVRRAVSTTYYAMFHCLARTCADRLIQRPGAPRTDSVWNHVYRSLQHRNAKRQCSNASVIAAFPTAVRGFASAFARLQGERHRADYDPTAVFRPGTVRRHLNAAARRIRHLENAPDEDLRAFAAWVLLASRRS